MESYLEPLPAGTPEVERARCEDGVKNAIAATRLSGGTLSEEWHEQAQKYIDGSLSAEQWKEQIIQHYKQ